MSFYQRPESDLLVCDAVTKSGRKQQSQRFPGGEMKTRSALDLLQTVPKNTDWQPV